PVPPTPPGPTPNPDPFSGKAMATASPSLRVLIVYESSTLSQLPKAQAGILTDGNLRAYLTSHCVTGADGKTADWRIWDKDVNTAAESPVWQRVMARPKASIPWIVIGDGSAGFEGALPADSVSPLALVQKFGGQ